MSRRFTTTHALVAIVLLGAALRLFPIWFGLPSLWARPDEDAAVDHAMAILAGDPNPHFFHWPSFTFYLFAALFAVASWIRRVLLLEPALSGPAQLIVARGCVAMAGTVTIVVVFMLARRVAGETTGLLAALFLAVALLHVRDSHFAMTDVLMTCLVLSSLACLVYACDLAGAASPDPRALRWFAVAGLAGGLAASTKYSGTAIIAGMTAAQLVLFSQTPTHVLRPAAWRPLLVFVVVFGIGFIIATPYALLDYGTFSRDVAFDATHLSKGHSMDVGPGWWYHLTRSLPYAAGTPVYIAGLAGAVPLVRHYPRHAVVIGAFALAFFGSIGSGHAVFFRYILPLIPIVCVLAAVAVLHAAGWLEQRWGVRRGVALGFAIAFLAGPALVNSAWLDLLLARTDTRVVAGHWLMAHVKPEESLFEAGSIYGQAHLAGASFHRWSYLPDARAIADPDARIPDWLVFPESPLWTYGTVSAELHRLAAEKYVLIRVVKGTKGEPTDRARSAAYDLEDAFFLPMSAFNTIERPGPTMSIYRKASVPRVAGSEVQ